MPKKTVAKKRSLGADLVEGMKLVLAQQRGELRTGALGPHARCQTHHARGLAPRRIGDEVVSEAAAQVDTLADVERVLGNVTPLLMVSDPPYGVE